MQQYICALVTIIRGVRLHCRTPSLSVIYPFVINYSRIGALIFLHLLTHGRQMCYIFQEILNYKHFICDLPRNGFTVISSEIGHVPRVFIHFSRQVIRNEKRRATSGNDKWCGMSVQLITKPGSILSIIGGKFTLAPKPNLPFT